MQNNNVLKKLLGELEFGQFTSVAAVKAFTTVLSFLLGVVLTRSFGAEGFGIYTLNQSIILGLGILLRRGQERAIIKYAGIENGLTGRVHNYVKLAIRRSINFSIFVGVISVLCLIVVFKFLSQSVFYVFLISVPFMSISIFIGCLFRGGGLTRLGVFVENGFFQLLMLMIIYGFSVFNLDFDKVTILAICFTLSWLIVSVIASIFYVFLRDKKIEGYDESKKIDFNEVSSSFLYLNFLGYIQKAFVFVVVGFFVTPDDLALLKVSERLTLPVLFALTVINSIYPQKFSRAWSRGDVERMQSDFKVSLAVSSLFGVFAFMTLLLFGDYLLLLFGEEFQGGFNVLSIVLLGAIINVLTGPVGSILNMSGFHKVVKNIALINGVISLIHLIFLSYNFGVYGAAWSIAVSGICLNLLMVYILIRSGHLKGEKNI